MTHIHLYLSNDILKDVFKEKSIVVLWLKLEQLCMTKSLPSNCILNDSTLIV